MAVYPDTDGGTVLGTTGALSCPSGRSVISGSVSISVTAWDTYRFCFCSTDPAVDYLSTYNPTDELVDLLDTFSLVVSTAANSCTAGAPPTTTGALTDASNTFEVPAFGLEIP